MKKFMKWILSTFIIIVAIIFVLTIFASIDGKSLSDFPFSAWIVVVIGSVIIAVLFS